MLNVLKRESSSSWSTPERTRLAGIAGMVGGIVLTAVAIIANAFTFEFGTPAHAAIGLFHTSMYTLMLVTLLAAGARYDTEYGRLGRTAVYVLGISFLVLIPLIPLVEFVFGEDWMPGAIMAGIAFLAMHLFASIFGIVLWRRTAVSRLAAGLFIAVVPAVVAVIALETLGLASLTPAAFEAPLYLGFAALGYDLWNGGRNPATTTVK